MRSRGTKLAVVAALSGALAFGAFASGAPQHRQASRVLLAELRVAFASATRGAHEPHPRDVQVHRTTYAKALHAVGGGCRCGSPRTPVYLFTAAGSFRLTNVSTPPGAPPPHGSRYYEIYEIPDGATLTAGLGSTPPDFARLGPDIHHGEDRTALVRGAIHYAGSENVVRPGRVSFLRRSQEIATRRLRHHRHFLFFVKPGHYHLEVESGDASCPGAIPVTVQSGDVMDKPLRCEPA